MKYRSFPQARFTSRLGHRRKRSSACAANPHEARRPTMGPHPRTPHGRAPCCLPHCRRLPFSSRDSQRARATCTSQHTHTLAERTSASEAFFEAQPPQPAQPPLHRLKVIVHPPAEALKRSKPLSPSDRQTLIHFAQGKRNEAILRDTSSWISGSGFENGGTAVLSRDDGHPCTRELIGSSGQHDRV